MIFRYAEMLSFFNATVFLEIYDICDYDNLDDVCKYDLYRIYKFKNDTLPSLDSSDSSHAESSIGRSRFRKTIVL